jgi:hypothetical protein
MSRLPWLNALLLVTVVGLGVFIYLNPREDASGGRPLSQLKPSEVSSIRIERRGAVPIDIEKKEGRWRVTAPLVARADETRVQRLLEILEAKPAAKMTADGLARFELDAPAARMTIGGNQTFAFGMLNELTREQYVMTAGAVYAVSPRFGAALPAVPAAMASKQLFGTDEIPVRIKLKDFAVEQKAGKWTLAPAPAGELSQDDYARWAEGWRFASALRVEPYVGGKPRADIEIGLKSGAGITLGVLSSGANLVLTRPDEKLQYHFNITTARRLLSPPGARNAPAPKK